MFVIILDYIKPLELIEKHLIEHRQYLTNCYEQNYFLTAGPKNPRDGGVIISILKDRNQLESILKQDPFVIHELVKTTIIEFNPATYHKDFEKFLNLYEDKS